MDYWYNHAGSGGPDPMVLLAVVITGTGGGSFTFSLEVLVQEPLKGAEIAPQVLLN
jgi:hypothetical protein